MGVKFLSLRRVFFSKRKATLRHFTPSPQNRFPTPFNKSGSHSQLWYSLDVGPVHVIAMTPYAPFDHTSEQVR